MIAHGKRSETSVPLGSRPQNNSSPERATHPSRRSKGNEAESTDVRKPIAIDLFSGCGGLTLGLKQAGFRVLAAVELDPLAVETYVVNHKRVRLWQRDIRRVSVAETMRALNLARGELDLLAGCPPCQGFSSMTTLNGKRQMRHPQNDLVFDFLRFVRRLLPKAVMLENVPGLARSGQFRKLRAALGRLGYACEYTVLDAAKYGVPQRRRRFVLVGSRISTVRFAREARVRRTVRHALTKLGKRAREDALHTLGEKRSRRIAALIRRIPKNGGSRLDLGSARQLQCHRACDGFKDVYGRMAWNDSAPTITGGCVNPSKGRFLHPTKNRTITLREAALLQTFPPAYFFSLRRGKFAVAQMIGQISKTQRFDFYENELPSRN
jgi:DNA (cytosine-5)-methyltransferase 1